MAPRPALLAVPVVLALCLSSAATASQPTPQAPAATALAVAPETADDLPPGSLIADEQIYELVRAGDRVYAKGYFETVGRYAGPGAVLDAETGEPGTSPTIADGQVSVSVSDGAGGWYLGGDFTRIGGHDAGGLAHVLADGTLDTGFLPVADRLVSALALVGDTLYVGGAFSTIGDTPRERLAAVSVEDGAVLPFAATQAARVTELLYAPAAGERSARLFVASDGLQALDPTTGAAVPGFSATAETPIHALELGGDRLYVGAAEVVALDATTGAADPAFDTGTPLAADLLRRVHTLLYTEDRLYVGGDRTLIGGKPGRLVAVDPATGDVDSTFAPDITTVRNLDYVPAGVYDLALDGDRLWAAGSFAGGLTIVDAETGAFADTELPSYNLQANAVELSGGQAYVGGHFYMVDAVRTHGIAALDAATLDPVPGFRANTNTWGNLFVGAGALWVANTNFLGYDPSEVAAETDDFFYSYTSPVVAIDPDTGQRIAKRSMRVKNLTGITTIGDRLYVARRLDDDVRFPRNRVDVYGPQGKRVDTFRLPYRGYVTELSSLGGDLVAAGSFKCCKPAPRDTAILRMNPANGTPRRFDPKINGPVYDVARSNGGLVAAGLFGQVFDGLGSLDRPGLTRMDSRGHKDIDFVPSPFTGNRVLLDVVPLGDLLWVNGAAHEFLDAGTGAQVPDPTGLDGGPWWVVGTEDDLAFTSYLMPNLGGRTGFKLGFVARAG